MTDVSKSRATAPSSLSDGTLASLESLPADQADSIRELAGVARRRAERLQRLHEVGSALSRSLEEGEIIRELARQVARVIAADGIVVAHPDLERREIETVLRLVAGVPRQLRAIPLGHGPIAEVARTGRPVRIGEYDTKRHPAAMADDVVGDGGPARALLAVPMMIGIRLVGVIAVYSSVNPSYTAEDEELLLTMGAQAATALANARLYAESQRERRQSEALADVARAISESLRLTEVLHLTLRHTIALLRAEGACITLLSGDELEIVAAVGTTEALRGLRLPLGDSLNGRAIRESSFVIANAAMREGCFPPAQELAGIEKSICVPLITAKSAIGTLAAINRAADFTEDDARVLQRLADHVAVAIVNARLFEDVERHRRVVETSSDAIVITGSNRRIEFANPAAEQLFGFPGGRIVGMPAADLLAPEHREDAARRENLSFAGEAQHFETQIVRADGDRRTVAVSTAALHEGGQVAAVVSSLRDVTAERRARDAVIQSEARYRNLFETASDAIYTLDLQGVFTSANNATCNISGHAREELLGRSILLFMDSDEVPRVRGYFREARHGHAQRYECHFFRRSGERRLASVTNTPISRDGQVMGVLGVARDITADREREEALARSEARYLRLVESASDAIFTVDADGRFSSVNRSLERTLGRSRGELFGTRFVDVLEPDGREAMSKLFETTLRGAWQRGELRFRDAGGELRIGSLTTTPIVEDGRVTGALGIVRDVTEERSLGVQLLQREKLAAVGQLVSGVAHELNNPLAGVMAFSQLMLAMPGTSEEQQEALSIIHKEAKRAAKIVSDLLIFARQRHPEYAATDVNHVLQDTLDLRRYALRANQITVEVDLDRALPLTWADPFQLQQVFMNLITNAEQALRKHEGRKEIVLRTSSHGHKLVASVSDTGPGIPAETVGRIFDPFYTTKAVGEGTGLGLSISDAIVREHGGQIRVESCVGGGATFLVELPVLATPAQPNGTTAVAPAREVVPRTVLVVDDEPAIRAALSIFLEREGHVVDTVGTGAEALDHARSRRYDVILLDLRLPDMSGDAIFRELLASDPEHAARVIFATGDVESDGAQAFLRRSGRPVISKPFELGAIAELIAVETRA